MGRGWQKASCLVRFPQGGSATAHGGGVSPAPRCQEQGCCRCPLTTLASQAWPLCQAWAERGQGGILTRGETKRKPEMLGFEGQLEEQLGDCGRDPSEDPC